MLDSICMRIPNTKGCFVSLISASCLTVLLVLLLLAVLFQKSQQKINSLFQSDQSDEVSRIQSKGHSQPLNKDVLLKVAVLSDTENDWKNIREALAEINREKVAFIVLLGDATEFGVLEDFQDVKAMLDQTGTQYYVIPGDRDLYASRGTIEGFKQVFGKNYDFQEVRGIRFLFIDNASEYDGIDSVQMKFISDHIAESDFVFLHNPIEFDDALLLGRKGMGEFSGEVEKQRVVLLQDIQKSNVKAVFAGDQHRFAEIADKTKEGLTHFIIGSLRSDRNLDVPQYAILTVYADGDYYVQKVIL